MKFSPRKRWNRRSIKPGMKFKMLDFDLPLIITITNLDLEANQIQFDSTNEWYTWEHLDVFIRFLNGGEVQQYVEIEGLEI